MELKEAGLLVIAIVIFAISGCATYRTSSNIKSEPDASASSNAPVIITEGSLPDRKFKEIGSIEVSIKKLTVFNKDPTREQANEALIEKARKMGADAVINVTYKSGVGLTTWGYIDSKGIGVKFVE